MNLNQAKQRIQIFKDQFAPRYGEGHYLFACHAAFPIGFTPDMLYQIWANFREIPSDGDSQGTGSEIDLIAVSDLLLSALCTKTGRDIYEMDVKVRGLLLDELRTERFTRLNRLQEMAFFIFQYLDSVVAKFEFESFRETLYWNTLVTLAPQQAFHEITQKLGEFVRENNEGEIMRMRNLLESFAYQDKGMQQMEQSNFRRLLDYTKALKAHMLGYNAKVINQQVEKSGAIAFTDDPNAADDYYEIPLLEEMVDQVSITQENPELSKEAPLPIKEIFALVVGIDEYIYPSMRLSGCVNDVELISNYLKETVNKEHEYTLELTRLVNEKATSKNITATLNQFREQAGPEDIVFFYFAGHSIKDALDLDYTSLILHDTQIEWKDKSLSKADEFRLEPLVAEGWACDIVLFIDTHYCAAVIQNPYDHVIFFAACGADQEAFEHRMGTRTHGLFTFNLVKALRERKQQMTYQQLFQQLRVQMEDSGYEQTPVLLADQSRTYKYVFGEYAPESQELMRRLENFRFTPASDLDLSDLNLTFIPAEVFTFSYLENLNLSGNQLDGIPSKLMSLRILQRLDLRNNQITRINLDVLAMPSIKEIYLSGNPIADIEPELLDGDVKKLSDYLSDIKRNARNCYALFIAIDDYPEFPNTGSVNLRAAVSDAKALRQMLKSHFQTDRELNFQHRDLYNEDATKEAVIKALENVASQANENDVFLCYFAGHDILLKTSDAAWVLANSNGEFNGKQEFSTSELSAQIELLLSKNVNTILLNPPKWGPVEQENLVVVEPGIFNNEGPMPDGSYHSHFAYQLLHHFEAQKGQLNYRFFQEMGKGKPSFYKSRTGSKEMPQLKTASLNFAKTFLRSELGYGKQIRQRFQEAQSSNVLDLSGMDLDHIPPQVFEMENLYILNLAGNRIDFLPPRITELKALERLELEGNPILNLPQGILIEGGMRDIRNYFESLEVTSLEIPVVISIFCELEDGMKDLPNEIEQVLSPYREERLLESVALIDPTSDEIFRLFHNYNKNEIALVNLSANTNKEIIRILNPAGRQIEIPVTTFLKLVGDLGNIKMVLMDGSESEELAYKMMEQGISAAIGVTGTGNTNMAMQFWRAYYQCLANGHTLREAFEKVKIEMVFQKQKR